MKAILSCFFLAIMANAQWPQVTLKIYQLPASNIVMNGGTVSNTIQLVALTDPSPATAPTNLTVTLRP